VYARSTTINARPENIDAGIAYVRDDVLPKVQRIDGCTGLSMIVDRDSGRCIVTAGWESEEALRNSADQVSPMRDRAAELFGGTPEVEVWEVAGMHRDHTSRDGACVRVTWMKGDPANADRAIDTFKLGVLPALEELEGFCSASLLIDRATGRAVSSVTYDSVEAMRATRGQATTLRTGASQEAGAEILDVCEFDLALAHLHVPEMV